MSELAFFNLTLQLFLINMSINLQWQEKQGGKILLHLHYLDFHFCRVFNLNPCGSGKEQDAAGDGVAQTQRTWCVMDNKASREWQGAFQTSEVTPSWLCAHQIRQGNKEHQRMEGAGVRTELVSGVGSRSRNQAWGRVSPQQRAEDNGESTVQHLFENAAVLLGKNPNNISKKEFLLNCEKRREHSQKSQ